MAQHDYNIANASFPTVRTDINNVLSAINTCNSGSSRPSGAVAGTIWLDTSGAATAHLLKFYDGAADILLGTINTTANTVDWSDSTVVADLVGDTSPQLGGMLDVNGNSIGDGTLELLKFTETGSAVNEFTIANAAAGAGPTLSASGTETNVDINITPKGTGDVVLAGDTVSVGDSGAAATLRSNGAGTLTVTTGGTTDLILSTNNGTNSGTIQITDAANGDIDLTCNGTGIININDRADYPQVALSSSSNATAWDSQAAPNAYHLTTENTTFSAPTNPATGAFISLNIKYGGTHTIGWNTVFEFAASTEPTETAVSGKHDHHIFRYNGAVWQEMGRNLNMATS
jgi:hypothetical protein